MARVKGGVTAMKRRKNILAMTKGYRFGRSTKTKQAKEAIFHAGKYAFAHRKDKKNDYRRLWNVRINAGLDTSGAETKLGKPLSYSRLIDALKKANVTIDRKILATLAEISPATFDRIVKKVS
ncbi:MAG: 50S ribosomal protein L20 [bacterium]